MQKEIYSCLWFDKNGKEAAEFYCSVFGNSKITESNHLVTMFETHGQHFMCLSAGPIFKPNPSISFLIMCETVEETQRLHSELSEGGMILMPLDKYDWSESFSWVQDKYGFTWQIYLGKLEDVGQKFTPSLLFNGNKCGKAEEAIQYYTSIFKQSKIDGIMKYPDEDKENAGLVMHGQFRLANNTFMIMDSSFNHGFDFNEAISFVIECDEQEEIDYFWDKFTAEGEESQCGWLKDKYGVSWQIIPSVLKELMSDPERNIRVTNAFLKMKKFDIETILNA